MPVAKQGLGEKRPLLRNARNNRKAMFSVVRAANVAMQQRCNYNNKGAVLSAWSVQRSYLEDNWRYSSVAGYSLKLQNIHCCQETSTGNIAEE
jgi:hypothetical protein